MAREYILVVDDGADMRDLVIRHVLQPNDYQYKEAEDGLAAFEIISTDPPDLIVLDLQMPRLDGVGLLKKMSAAQINIPVVLMTFYGSEEIAIEVFRLGVRDYVIKPFTEEEMLEAIERALILTRLRNEHDSLTEQLMLANQELAQKVDELETLFRIGKVVASLADEETIVHRLLEAVKYLTGIQNAELLLLDQDQSSLVCRAVHSEDGVQFINQVVDNDLAWQSLDAANITKGRPYIDQINQTKFVPVCVPLIIGQAAMGVLVVNLPEGHANKHRLNVLQALADYGAIGLERAQLGVS